MSEVGPEGRSFRRIAPRDLRRLAQLAEDDRNDFFNRAPGWGRLYARRVLCSALCQGAALFAATGRRGINDFDIYTFYAEHASRRWYARRRATADFGNSKFGQSIDRPGYIGRRVDLMGRALRAEPGADPVRAVQEYLSTGRSKSVGLLSQRAVILLEPAQFLGWLVWLEGQPVLRRL